MSKIETFLVMISLGGAMYCFTRGDFKLAVLIGLIFLPFIGVFHFARLYVKKFGFKISSKKKDKKDEKKKLVDVKKLPAEEIENLKLRYTYMMIVSLLMMVVFIGVTIFFW